MLALLGVLAAPPAQAQARKVCNDVVLRTQLDVYRFDCDVVVGNLTIGGERGSPSPQITDLTPLRRLASVGRGLIINRNGALVSLTGLEGLTSVGFLSIRENPSLRSLTGLEALDAVGGSLFIWDNEALTSCSCGLSGLIREGRFVGISGAINFRGNAGGTCRNLAYGGVWERRPHEAPRGQERVAAACAADLALSVAGAPDPAALGSPLTYTLTVANFGPEPASGLTALLHLPRLLPVTGYGAGCAPQRTDLQWQYVVCSRAGELAPNAKAAFTVTARPAAPGTHTFYAQTGSALDDPHAENNTFTGQTTAAAQQQQGAEAAAGGAALAAKAALPMALALEGASPNPFYPATEIGFALPEARHVRLAVYDLLGREVTRLVDGALAAGRHRVRFEAGDLPSGTYLYRIEAGGEVEVRRMTLLK